MSSPCDNVRRSCQRLLMQQQQHQITSSGVNAMDDEDVHDAKQSNLSTTTTAANSLAGGCNDRGSSVSINHEGLDSLARKIALSILQHQQQQQQLKEEAQQLASSVATPTTASTPLVQWDEDEWHYTATNLRQGSTITHHDRCERVALYILALDAINFCFWPCPGLEYEHLAVALKRIAEADETTLLDLQINTSAGSCCGKAIDGLVKEGDNSILKNNDNKFDHYAFSPTQLSQLTPMKLHSLIEPHLPPGVSTLPLLKERCDLLVELGNGLMQSFHKSALYMIQCANNSATQLVQLIIDTFPGFRDVAHCSSYDQHYHYVFASADASNDNVDNGTKEQVFFYKRAQIAVADLWGAMGNRNSECNTNPKDNNVSSSSSSSSTPITVNLSHPSCYFQDIDQLTTFADYRVPQILRHENVLCYNPHLSNIVDNQQIMTAQCMDELYIRAATVVAVDRLVQQVKHHVTVKIEEEQKKTMGLSTCEKMDVIITSNAKDLCRNVNAVKIDWYLWQVGEKMMNERKLLPHHRVVTTYY